ncbi:MAG: precorrin-8X methylmutase [Leucothrix sp.]
MIKYERDPKLIQSTSIKMIREAFSLHSPDDPTQQLIIRMLYAYGDDSLINDYRFSGNAIASGLNALKKNANIICDSSMVIEGLKTDYFRKEPICLINRPRTISQAKAKKITRAMVSIEDCKRFLEGSIVLVGNEPTALFHLIDLLERDEVKKPALIIGMPRGYMGAIEAKQYLWDNHVTLGIPCITVLGSKGGSTLVASVINGLMYLKQGTLL